MREYEALLKEVAQREESALQNMSIASGQEQFLSELSQRTASARQRKVTWVIAAVAAVLLGVLGLAVFSQSNIWSQTGNTGSALSEHEWIQVGPKDSRLLRLTDGTRIHFLSNSTGRVSQTVNYKGDVTLESGRVALSVPHTDNTDWSVLAGPFKIAVTGTRFDVSWDSKRQDLAVNVYEGSVWVTGPLIEKGHAVTRNRSMSVNLQTASIRNDPLPHSAYNGSNGPVSLMADDTQGALSDNTIDSAAVDADDADVKEKDSRSSVTGKNLSHRAHLKTGKSASPWWLEDAQMGQYDRIAAAIRSKGLNQLLTSASPADWLVLGNAARRARDFDTARTIYLKLYQQTNKQHRAMAALYMGRMAFDQQRDYPTAAKWFNNYLREQKSGTLHREVLGRLMEAQYKSDMHTNARQTARQYLKSYPDGPHAAKARDIATE